MTSFVFTFPIINNKNCHLSKYLSLFKLQDTYFKKAKQNSKFFVYYFLAYMHQTYFTYFNINTLQKFNGTIQEIL